MWRLGRAYIVLNNYPRALEWLKKGVAINHEVGHQAFEGRSLQSIADIYFDEGKYDRALTSYQQALSLIQAVGIRELEGDLVASIGECYKQQKQYDRAIATYQKALLIAKEIGNQSQQVKFLKSIGNTYLEQKKIDRALDLYQQALKVAQEGSDKALQADVLGVMGDFYKQQNQYDKALAIYQQILPMFRELGDKAGEGRNLNATGYVYTLRKQYDQAIDYFQQALVIFRKIPDNSKVRLILNNLGDAYRFKEEYQQAIPYYQEAIEVARKIPDPDLEAESIQSLGYAYVGLQNFSKATETAEVSLAIYQRLDKSKQLERLSGITSLYTSIGVKAFGIGNSSIVSQVASRTIALTQARLKLGEELKNLPEKAQILLNLGDAYKLLADYPNSWSAYEQALIIYQKINDKLGQISTLLQIMRVHSLQSSALREQGNYSGSFKLSNNSLALVVSALQLSKESNLSKYEKEILIAQSNTYFDLGQVYLEQGNLNKAEEVAQQALVMGQKAENLQAQNSALSLLGSIYASRGEYRKLREVNQRELVLAQQISPASEAQSLLGIANNYRAFGDVPKSIEFAQQALQKAQTIETTKLPAGIRPYILKMQPTALRSVSQSYQYLGEYDKALEFAQESLRLAHTFSDTGSEIDALMVLGQIYAVRKDFQKAIALTQQAWDLSRTLKTSQFVNQPSIEQGTVIQLSQLYVEQEKLPEALELARLGLKIAQQSDNPALKINGLAALSKVYAAQGNISKAFDLLNQCAALSQKLPNSGSRGQTLAITAIAYLSLGDYQTSRALLQKALTDGQKSLPLLESVIWNALAYLSFVQGKPQETIKAAQKGIQVSEGRFLVLDALTNLVLSTGHGELGNDAKAIEAAQASLAIYRKLQDLNQEKFTLALIGDLHRKFGRPDEAITAYQTALAIGKTRDSYGVASNNAGIYAGLARIYADRNQPELAIIFYKQAINGIEDTRYKLQGLPTELQQSFLKATFDFGGVKTADVYRQFADLLLKQNRVLEAQQVLDLLKVQELKDYLRTVRGTTTQGLPLLPTERQIKEQYEQYVGKAIAISQELATLHKIPSNQRTPAQQERLDTLNHLQAAYQGSFNQFVQDPQIHHLIEQLAKVDPQNQSLNLANLNKSRDNLQAVQKALHINAVILYPLILKDRLELVLVTPDAPPIHKAVNVSQEELTHTISDFLSDLKDPRSNPQPNAQKLYRWLIQPIKAELDQTHTQNIFYAPDDQLRYIPLAALHDGKQYLVSQFQIDNIISANLQAIEPLPPFQPHVLAGAFVKGSYTVRVGDCDLIFQGLQFAGTEVRTLASLLPNTTTLLDKAFAKQTTVDQLSQYNIVHLATHGIFTDNGNPQDSFILFGDGDRATLTDVGSWDLSNVNLVVLSACQTATAATLGKGAPILGLGYQVQLARAQAAIASLWTVDDQGTQTLMDAFYTLLKQGKLTPVQALQQAQISLLTGKPANTTDAPQRASLKPVLLPGKRAANPATPGFSHPYYWAPFILIGNGL